MTIEAAPYESKLADAHVELVQRAFAIMPAGARPKDSPAYVRHMHSAANPAGQAWISVAREDERWIGSTSAIPARFRTRAGRIVTGYQIGYFAVDSAAQRRGLGTRLLDTMTQAFADRDDVFVYGYPNLRSQPVLERYGYRTVASIPTAIHPPRIRTLFARDVRHVELRGLGLWDLEYPNAAETVALIRSIARSPHEQELPGFVRDAAYFTWRFCGPDADRRYRFVVCRSRASDRALVLALASHTFKGLRFAILADTFPNAASEPYALAVRAAQCAGRRDGALFVYTNTNIDSIASTNGTPWSIQVPRSKDPRPVEWMVYPKTTAVELTEIGESLAMTADWMGF